MEGVGCGAPCSRSRWRCGLRSQASQLMLLAALLLAAVSWWYQAVVCMRLQRAGHTLHGPPIDRAPVARRGGACPLGDSMPLAARGVADDDRALPDLRFWDKVLPFVIVRASQAHQAVEAHEVWGRSIPGLVWLATAPVPALEAAGARVHVVASSSSHGTGAESGLPLDAWADVWARQAQPQHRWFVRLLHDSFVWRPGMERQIRSVEQLDCCAPDRPVLLGSRRHFSSRLNSAPFGSFPDRSPLIASRAAVLKLFGRNPSTAGKAVAVHRRWAREWCATGKGPAEMCGSLDGVLITVAALRLGVPMFEVHGVLVPPPLKPRGGEVAVALQSWRGQARWIRCRMPAGAGAAQPHLAPGTWALTHVPADELRDILAAFRAGCHEDIARASFTHATFSGGIETGLQPGDFLDVEAATAPSCWLWGW